ncbi:hypothetical protein WJX72_011987 [[Myrmecia] bisecta]|uniref:GON domain-containing protein n=1 Tax=[Myrmecia] bisecta TaxID=41462 RepID=A0AAW1RAZ6_9CHLO
MACKWLRFLIRNAYAVRITQDGGRGDLWSTYRLLPYVYLDGTAEVYQVNDPLPPPGNSFVIPAGQNQPRLVLTDNNTNVVGPYLYEGNLGVISPDVSPVPTSVSTDHIHVLGSYVLQPTITYSPSGGGRYTIRQTQFNPDPALLGSRAPGNTLICPSGDQHQITVFCNNGVAYLNLVTNPTTNFALYGKSPNTNGGTPTTQYNRVRFNPANLTIITTDHTFATNNGVQYCFGPTNCNVWVDYGVAADCAGGGSRSGRANINLVGSGLAVAPNPSQFMVSGNSAGGTPTFSSNNQVVDLQGGGSCGGIAPPGFIQLVYA